MQICWRWIYLGPWSINCFHVFRKFTTLGKNKTLKTMKIPRGNQCYICFISFAFACCQGKKNKMYYTFTDFWLYKSKSVLFANSLKIAVKRLLKKSPKHLEPVSFPQLRRGKYACFWGAEFLLTPSMVHFKCIIEKYKSHVFSLFWESWIWIQSQWTIVQFPYFYKLTERFSIVFLKI